MINTFDELLEVPTSQLAILFQEMVAEDVVNAFSEMDEETLNLFLSDTPFYKKEEIVNEFKKKASHCKTDVRVEAQTYLIETAKEFIQMGMMQLDQGESRVLSQDEIDDLVGFSPSSSAPVAETKTPSNNDIAIDQDEIAKLLGL